MAINDIRERDFELFVDALRIAGKRMDDPHIFRLPVISEEEGKKVFRERVYCYELYHQLRIVLGDLFPYKLHGEVDKAGHEFIPGAKKPDFIVHVPGEMDKNLVVIEVKPMTVKDHIDELENDLETLQIFLGKEGQYYRGILLVYGDNEHELPEIIRFKVINFSEGCENRIFLVWHRGWGQEPEVLY